MQKLTLGYGSRIDPILLRIAASAPEGRFGDREARRLAFQLRNAIELKGDGFLPDGRPLTVAYALLARELGMDRRAIVKRFSYVVAEMTGVRKLAAYVQANLVALAVENPGLAPICDVTQLKNFAGLMDNLTGAYRVAKDASTVTAGEPLRAMAEELNRYGARFPIAPEDIMPLDLWRETVKAKTGVDPMPLVLC